MDDEIEQIIDNEREWRRSLFTKMTQIEKKLDAVDGKYVKVRIEVARLKVWNIIWRAGGSIIFTSLFALIFYLLKSRIEQ